MTNMTTNELATALSTDGRNVRKFLRSITPKDDQPGKGSRWSIPANKPQLVKLGKQFADWKKAQDTERAAYLKEKAARAEAEVATQA